jgi:hypothetical protein
LPFGLNTHVAARVMGEDRWAAGADLMHAAKARDWDQLVADGALARANREAIDSCGDLAARKKPCVVTLKASGAPAPSPR